MDEKNENRTQFEKDCQAMIDKIELKARTVNSIDNVSSYLECFKDVMYGRFYNDPKLHRIEDLINHVEQAVIKIERELLQDLNTLSGMCDLEAYRVCDNDRENYFGDLDA